MGLAALPHPLLPGRGRGRAVLPALTHKALSLAVPERGGTHPVGHQRHEGFLDLLAEWGGSQGVPEPTPPCPSLAIPCFVTSREMSKTTSLQLVGTAS